MKKVLLVLGLLVCCCSVGFSESLLPAGRVRIETYFHGMFQSSQTGDIVDDSFVAFWQEALGRDLNDQSKMVNWRQDQFDGGYTLTVHVYNKAGRPDFDQ